MTTITKILLMIFLWLLRESKVRRVPWILKVMGKTPTKMLGCQVVPNGEIIFIFVDLVGLLPLRIWIQVILKLISRPVLWVGTVNCGPSFGSQHYLSTFKYYVPVYRWLDRLHSRKVCVKSSSIDGYGM